MISLTGLEVLRTIIVHRPGKLNEILGQETTVICGSQRGNTSAVAYTVFNLGYFLGDRIGAKNYEDREILSILPDPALRNQFSEDVFSEFVRRRNSAHARWGFKVPHASGYVAELATLLRNPVFLVCFRNPVSVLRSISKRESKRFPIEKTLRIAARSLEAAQTIVKQTEAPAVLIDTDEAVRHPEIFVNEIASVLGLQTDPRIAEAISKKGYKLSEPRAGIELLAQ